MIITIAPCSWGGCAVQGGALAEVGGTCSPNIERLNELKQMLTGEWTQ